jgi:hypothetical protein
MGHKVMDVWTDSGEHHEARQSRPRSLAKTKRARASGVAGCLVESTCHSRWTRSHLGRSRIYPVTRPVRSSEKPKPSRRLNRDGK